MSTSRPDDEWIELIYKQLTLAQIPEDQSVNDELSNNPSYQKLVACIQDLRELSHALSKGDLQKFAFSKGYILSNLKALQANLRHLTWQTGQVAQGDFSQRVEFLGDFSDSFNGMVKRLEDNTQALEHIANIDYLTQIPNRRSGTIYLERIFALSKRNSRVFSVVIFDIDHFKDVNDTYGHEAGDVVLRSICQKLSGIFRGSDLLCRFGGEEFMAVLPETDIKGAAIIAERARIVVAGFSVPINENTTLVKTISAGASEFMPGDKDYGEAVARADAALYRAKNGGRDRVCTDPELDMEKLIAEHRTGRLAADSAAENSHLPRKS